MPTSPPRRIMSNDNLSASVLSSEEVEALEKDLEKHYGVSPAAPPKPSNNSNKALNSLFNNVGSENRTRSGNRIIPGSVFDKMVREDIPFEDEFVLMRTPEGYVSAIPARKYTKYIGEGRVIVRDDDLAPQQPENTVNRIYINGVEYNIYLCSEKYADCIRLFDSTRGRLNHWKADHEQAWGKKTRGKYAGAQSGS